MKRKTRLNKKKLLIVVSIVSFLFIGIGNSINTLASEKKEEIARQKEILEQARLEEKKKNEKFIGVNSEGKKDAYDAKIISEKLNNYDYTNNGEKIVFLTFDDGASTTVTPDILDTLERENVKGTFFVTGNTAQSGGEEAKNIIKRAFNNGNAIANHSWSHDYSVLYPGRTLDVESFKSDFNKTDEYLKEVLGENFSTRVLRCPGGYMSWNGMENLDFYLNESNKVSIDWNALNKDAEGKKKNANELVQEAINSIQGKEMVVLLMHDTYGKGETAKALPEIIKYLKENGYEFKTLV